MSELLVSFQTKNKGRLPEKVIFYRLVCDVYMRRDCLNVMNSDGVSEGQFQIILHRGEALAAETDTFCSRELTEVPALAAALAKFTEPNGKPPIPITYCIAAKRRTLFALLYTPLANYQRRS